MDRIVTIRDGLNVTESPSQSFVADWSNLSVGGKPTPPVEGGGPFFPPIFKSESKDTAPREIPKADAQKRDDAIVDTGKELPPVSESCDSSEDDSSSSESQAPPAKQVEAEKKPETTHDQRSVDEVSVDSVVDFNDYLVSSKSNISIADLLDQISCSLMSIDVTLKKMNTTQQENKHGKFGNKHHHKR